MMSELQVTLSDDACADKSTSSESADPLHFRVESADNQRTGTAGVPVCTVWRPDEAGSVQRGEGRTCVY